MLLRTGAATLGLALGPWTENRARGISTSKVLFFSKSSGFEHSPIKRRSPQELSFAEQILKELGPKHGIEFTAGVTNIADKNPPIVGTPAPSDNTFAATYDIAGRTFFIGLSVKY